MKSYQVDGMRIGQARQAVLTEDGKPLKQVEAAERLGVHPVTLNRIENGKAKVSLELLERLALLTGRSREWLLGEPEPEDEFAARSSQLAEAMAHLAASFELMNALMAKVHHEVTAARVAA
ncbi:MAG TPA: helix-turn-helix transcriptional regulator [Plantibacter sp.]|uniref:helix-turn-helix domain-containing protein n=1 Tax=Plantibacter sp. TaxID=1871045 RepID=UPI002BB712FA|nr:helix-turn-helix transcriptional regulator [Plantibacter sp.]